MRGPLSRKRRPALSVVVISYNMSRELPRTLLSLSPLFQAEIDESEYEIVVVDNGSKKPPIEQECQLISPNIRVLKHGRRSASPVGAVNQGLEASRGINICVMIDGARMASPRLLASGLAALRTSPKTVVGTLGFHLGREVQMRSVLKGYNEAAEDALLESVPWRNDGYCLFDISVPGGSSAGGWFRLPGETNALLMSASQWKKLGGYETKFASPGGGQANHDMWRRACINPGSEVVLLAGEATFHQFHGGIATNAVEPSNADFKAEYQRIRGEAYKRPAVPFRLFGAFGPHHYPTLLTSLEIERERSRK